MGITKHININKNLTINNMLVNLKEEGYRDQVLTYNYKILDGLDKIKDCLEDGALVEVGTTVDS